MCGTFEYGLNAAAKEFDGKNKYIRITDIDDASREFLLSDLSSPDICLDGMSKYLLSSGDIVFARTGASVGKTYIYRENDGIVYFAGFLIRAKVNQDNDAEFVFQSTLSPSYEKYIRITSQRSGQPGVNAQEYGEYDLFAPSKEEQQRIGHFLRGIDNLITLHQRQPFLHSTPDISLSVRLIHPFYTSSWEQRKLGDVVQITMGQSPDGSTYSDEPSDYILVQGNADLQNGWVCPRIWTTQITKKADAGDLIMSVRAPAGAMGKTAYNAVIGRGVAAIKGNEFIYQLLVKMDTDGFWKTLSCGSTFESLNSDNIKNAEVKIPTTAEQIKIGGYFQQLDNLITLHQRECISFTARAGRRILSANKKRNTSSWEQRKLGELVDVCSGRDYKHLSEGTIPVYGTGGYMLSVNDALSYDRDAIGIGRKGTIDRPYILKAPFWTVDTLFYAIPREKADLNFAFDIFQNIDWKKKDESTGVPSLSKTAINDIDVLAPKHGEQQAIGQFFAAIDHLITLHQRKEKAAVSGCSNNANNSKGVCCKARDFGYKCHKKDESK